MRLRSVLTVAAMALLIMLAGTAVLAQPDRVGPQALWKLPPNLYGQFSGCGDRLDCLMAVMKKGKASPEAMAFTRRMKDNCYLEEFKKMGTVDLAYVVFPGRANTNWAYFLVNGSPWQVSTEDIETIDITKGSLYAFLSQQYKEIGCWPPAMFKEMQTLPDGGQRFVFAYTLIDGPRAGKRVGSALVSFDFNRAGTFLGTKLLRLTQEMPQ